MADNYDKNGYNSSDFKRNKQDDNEHGQDGDEGGPKLNEKAGEYMRELLSEKIKIDQEKFPMSTRLLDAEVTKVQATGRIPEKDNRYVDVYRDKVTKVTVKVLVPIKEHPKFNFVGKLLGPKGNTMKQLQEDTMCKMAILGKGSMKDRRQEGELRNSLDPKYAHLADELHVEISALAPPAEAYARIAYALAEVKKYLVPDTNDAIRQNQMREFFERPDGRPPLIGPPKPQHPPRYNAMRGDRPPNYQEPGMQGPGPRGPPPPRMPPGPPRPMPGGKTKVLSILDRARSAMETSYPPYDDPYAAPEPPVRAPPVRAPPAEPEYFGYERGGQSRYFEEEPYYKDEREFKPSARDVGTRRAPQAARHFARASPYTRPHK